MKHDEQVENLRQAIDRDLLLFSNIHEKCSRLRNYPQYDIEELLRHARGILDALRIFHRQRYGGGIKGSEAD